jgi:hypothetical protein
MLGRPPQLWTWMTTRWCPLPASQAWILWRALTRAEWPKAVQWRTAFLAYDAPDRLLSRAIVEAFLAEVAQPKHLISLLEALAQEKMLLSHDARRIEGLLLEQVNKDGQWKQQQKGGRDGRTDRRA